MTRFRPTVKSPHPIQVVELIPSGGGVFDVVADGQLVYSKHQTGRHVKNDEVLESIAKLLET